MVEVETGHPVATDSPDHLQPWGTARDNSRNPRFNERLYRLFETPPRVLDLGCSGGGFVRDCLDDGCFAVGIEGSDYSKRMLRAEWPRLADRFLFTADITKPFTVNEQFDVVTAWEVLEHLPREGLEQFCANVKRHLAPAGLAIFSISSTEEVIHGTRLHQTVESKRWWTQEFARNGLTHLPAFEDYFNGQYVRGPLQNAPDSFHLILSTDIAQAPQAATLPMRQRLLDRWYRTRLHRLLRVAVGLR